MSLCPRETQSLGSHVKPGLSPCSRLLVRPLCSPHPKPLTCWARSQASLPTDDCHLGFLYSPHIKQGPCIQGLLSELVTAKLCAGTMTSLPRARAQGCSVCLSTVCRPSSASLLCPRGPFLTSSSSERVLEGGIPSAQAQCPPQPGAGQSAGRGVWDRGMGGPNGAWAQSFRNTKRYTRGF